MLANHRPAMTKEEYLQLMRGLGEGGAVHRSRRGSFRMQHGLRWSGIRGACQWLP